MSAILEGIKVLDLTRVVAGPWATQNLADMGATVYKIEKPGDGDDTRKMGPFLTDADGAQTNDSAFYLACNRGKQSVTIDISRPQGAELVRQLAARCDVVVENYKAGSLKKYGLDYESIRALRPDVIYCSVTGFGPDGPYAARPAYDFILQGMAGLMSTCGQPDGTPGGEPMRTAIPITDILTGLYATIALLGALYHRQATGEGQYIDAAMLDASVAVNGHLALGYQMTGKLPRRAGNTNPVAAPSEVFACRDGHLIVAAGNNGQFAALCKLLGCPELATDARFVQNLGRVTHRDALRDAIGSRIAGWSTAELLAALEHAGVPGGPINRLDEVFEDAQVRHRDLLMHLPHGRGVAAPSLRSPLRFSATPVRMKCPPMLGEHTAQALGAELGLREEDIAALQEKGIL
ncbi:CaiB/BaiF CoA-transferase family protein [Cupriavidus basilensis]|uniref:CaiB/BaiF CoA-transferase family protein n=1 Tax=Cupriavidus basilensis TaxID=68895 RepID=A0ABT6AZE8_9BURK|nr:CaiB/BaiF CoA-transferase family protein [Cupriavidus basilensis]MDF3837992.1 CaiB/BaiF CoA-transferase family protein [Cupriavidus basilensis]